MSQLELLVVECPAPASAKLNHPRIFKRGRFWWCKGATLVPAGRDVQVRTVMWSGDTPAQAFQRWSAITDSFVLSYKKVTS